MLSEREERVVRLLDEMIADEDRAVGEYGEGHRDGRLYGLKTARWVIVREAEGRDGWQRVVAG